MDDEDADDKERVMTMAYCHAIVMNISHGILPHAHNVAAGAPSPSRPPLRFYRNDESRMVGNTT